MFVSKQFRILMIALLTAPLAAQAAEQPKEKDLKITTTYSLNRIWAPMAGALLGGIIYAGLPATIFTCFPHDPGLHKVETISPIKVLQMACSWGCFAGIQAGAQCIDAGYCSKCHKPVSNNETGLSVFSKFVGGGILGTLAGTGLCALGYQFYPDRMPTQIGAHDIIKMLGLCGAYFGFVAGKDYMKESICSECQANADLVK